MDLPRRCQEIVADRSKSAAVRLDELTRATWAWEMHEFPERATWTGWKGDDASGEGNRRENGRWSDRSRAAIERRRVELRAPVAAAKQLEREVARESGSEHGRQRAALSAAQRLNLELFRIEHERAVEETTWPFELLALSQMDGVHQDTAQLLAVAPAQTTRDLEDVLARLEGMPALFEQTTELLREGLARKVTPPRIALRDVPSQVERLCVRDAAASPLLGAFAPWLGGSTSGVESGGAVGSVETHRKLASSARRVFEQSIVPALRRFHDFVATSYLPGCRESTGWRDLPDGEAWYAFKVREQTTTTLTPKEIHAIGLAEVERIRAAMDVTIAQSDFSKSRSSRARSSSSPANVRSPDDFAAFCDFLRTDRRFYFDRAEDLLAAYRELCKRIDPQLVKLFGRLPRLPYGVAEVPAHAAESQTTAYYLPGSPEAARPGWFFANTSKLDSRPKWEMEALTLHEAVPGHHLQIALAQELELPEFRRHGGCNSYVEGWALYAESLGGELGLYTDPHARFGQLSYEMWRAIRLVVDTGMHALGWSRQKAIDFFASHTGKPLHDVTVEVDRYLVWPAQALSYKIGELRIRELRREAESALRERFDLRAFHDELLGEGALPLDLLTKRMRAWIAARGG